MIYERSLVYVMYLSCSLVLELQSSVSLKINFDNAGRIADLLEIKFDNAARIVVEL